VPAEIVGVMPEGFAFPLRQDLWMVLRLDLDDVQRWRRGQLQILGRMWPESSASEVADELTEISRRLVDRGSEVMPPGQVQALPYIERYTDPRTRSSLYIMLLAVLGILLIACANVTNLLLARSALRTQDVAVRFALGASRGRMVAQLLAESLVLAASGGVLGLFLAMAGVDFYRRALADQYLSFWVDVRLDPVVLLFAVGVTFLASLVSGLLPALRTSGARAHEVLKDQSAGSDGRRSGRFSRALVVAEVALSCGILVATGLTVKSLVNLNTIDLSFETEYVLTAQVALPLTDYPTADEQMDFFQHLLGRLDDVSGVEFSSLTSDLPGSRARQAPLWVAGREREEHTVSPRSAWSVVSPGFLSTFGVDLLAGRPFSDADDADSLPVVIVNRSFVQQHLGMGDPLGRRIRLDLGTGVDADQASADSAPWRRVVGVVPDLRMAGLDKDEVSCLFLPLAQRPTNWMTLAVRATHRPEDLIPLVRKEVVALDPELPLFWVMSMDEEVATSTRELSVYGSLFTVFGLVALFLAAIGLYGVVSVSASRRVQECGLRMALGAESRHVVSLILREGLGQLFWGLAIGLVLAAAISRLLTVLLFQVKPWDPVVFAAVILVLLIAGLTACWLPASRAAGVDPIVALRND
jgi:predicted permease